MKLYKEILVKVIDEQQLNAVCPNLRINTTKIIEMECYKALQKIKTVIEDDSLSDPECFAKIEKIVCIFENIGSNGGNRHDFG